MVTRCYTTLWGTTVSWGESNGIRASTRSQRSSSSEEKLPTQLVSCPGVHRAEDCHRFQVRRALLLDGARTVPPARMAWILRRGSPRSTLSAGT